MWTLLPVYRGKVRENRSYKVLKRASFNTLSP
jgi:hypothetical protein